MGVTLKIGAPPFVWWHFGSPRKNIRRQVRFLLDKPPKWRHGFPFGFPNKNLNNQQERGATPKTTHPDGCLKMRGCLITGCLSVSGRFLFSRQTQLRPLGGPLLLSLCRGLPMPGAFQFAFLVHWQGMRELE